MTKAAKLPEWFTLSEQLTPLTFKRLDLALSNLDLPIEVKQQPLQAFWHLLNVLYIANKANREGMHANALSITRQCIECISLIEIGLSRHPEAFDLLSRWNADKVRPGDLRKWLQENVWASYGNGLWSESWSDYMAALAKSLQPYAHYAAPLSQWYGRLHDFQKSEDNSHYLGVIELGPKTYDPQKATRITLYHAVISYTLARIWAAAYGIDDIEFLALVERLRIALGVSHYFEGDGTKWDQQFWALLWFPNGNPE